MQRKVTAVLRDEVYQEIEKTEAFCAKIVDKKNASVIIKEISNFYPIPSLKHLKRVKAEGNNLYILVTTKSDEIDSEVELEQHCKVNGLTDFSDIQVPKWLPLTRSQYHSASMLWPTRFHEDKYLERSLKGELFSEKELSVIEEFMKMAITECNSMTVSRQEKPVGAVIVDPETGLVAARGSSSLHPLRHAVMVCLDAVAMAQGGGAWNRAQQSSLLQWKSLDGFSDEVCRRPLSKQSKEDKKVDIGDESLPKKIKFTKQYLCTGYDIYVTMEPCVMCAMALLHSRIRRVFYGRLNYHSGGLGSRFKIHSQTKLNHHFEVFCT